MSSKFDSFDQSPLGALIESPLGARGIAAEPGALFISVDGLVWNGVTPTHPGKQIQSYNEKSSSWLDVTEGSHDEFHNVHPYAFNFCIHNGDLYASMNTLSPYSNNVARFNKSTNSWESIDTEVINSVGEIISYSGKIYGMSNQGVLSYDGNSWVTVTTGIMGRGGQFASTNGLLYAVSGSQHAVFDGANWSFHNHFYLNGKSTIFNDTFVCSDFQGIYIPDFNVEILLVPYTINSSSVTSMIEFNGEFYFYSSNTSSGGRAYKVDGLLSSSPTVIDITPEGYSTPEFRPGFNNENFQDKGRFVLYKDKLLLLSQVGVIPALPDMRNIFVWDGLTWSDFNGCTGGSFPFSAIDASSIFS